MIHFNSNIAIILGLLQFLGTCQEQSGTRNTSPGNYLPGSTSGKTSPGNYLPPKKPLPGTTYLRETLSRELPTSGKPSPYLSLPGTTSLSQEQLPLPGTRDCSQELQ